MSRKKICYYATLIIISILCITILFFIVNNNNIKQNAIATAQYLSSHPIPIPTYIIELRPAPGEDISSGKPICAILSIGYLAESNNQVDTIAGFLAKNTQITIKGEFPFFYKTSASWAGPLSTLPNGKLTGVMEFCIEEHLSPGIYSAELVGKDTREKQFSYMWSFNIK